MMILTNFLRSLLLTTLFSFIAPIFLIGGLLAFLSLMVYIPGLPEVIAHIPSAIMRFLATFGSGSSWRGLFVIGLTCGFVGGLFDTYTYYRYQILRIDS